MKTVILTSFAVLAFSFSVAQESSSTTEIDQLIQSNQFAKAIELLEQTDDSLSVEILRRKGHCYFQLGNYNDAITQYETAIDIDSTNANALYALGQLYGRNKQYAQSFVCYNKLLTLDSLNSFYYKQYGIVAFNAGALSVALTNFFRAVQLNPDDMESNSLLADILIEGGEFAVADNLLTSAMKRNSSPQLSLLLARAKLGEKQYHTVIRITEKLIEESDTLPAYSRLMAIATFQINKYEESITWMQNLLSQDMKGEWIYYYMGLSYQNLGKPDSAIVYLNKAIEEGISVNITSYYTQLASSYESIDNFRMAIKYYKAAYETSKRDILLYHLGRNCEVYYKDKAQAIAYFKRYLDSDDTVRLAREYARSRLNELEFYR